MTKEQVVARLKKQRREGERVCDFAARVGEYQSYLWRILEGELPPSPKVLKFLGLRKVKTITYEKT